MKLMLDTEKELTVVSLCVGGLEIPITREQAFQMLFGNLTVPKVKKSQKKQKADSTTKVRKKGSSVVGLARVKKGLCFYCEKKVAPGKKVCRKHLQARLKGLRKLRRERHHREEKLAELN